MPALTFEQIHQRLTAQFGDAIGPLQPAKKDPWCTFAPGRVVEVCRFLKATPDFAFDFLEDISATDHPKEGLIRVVYHFYSYRHRHTFIAKAEFFHYTAKATPTNLIRRPSVHRRRTYVDIKRGRQFVLSLLP